MGAQYYEGDQFLAFLGDKEGKQLILTYVTVFRGARSAMYEKFLLCDKVPLSIFSICFCFLKHPVYVIAVLTVVIVVSLIDF